MDIGMTGIIGRACTVHINYWKWAEPLMRLQTLCTSSSNSDVPLLLASGAKSSVQMCINDWTIVCIFRLCSLSRL